MVNLKHGTIEANGYTGCIEFSGAPLHLWRRSPRFEGHNRLRSKRPPTAQDSISKLVTGKKFFVKVIDAQNIAVQHFLVCLPAGFEKAEI
jgi:hypothetical protein